MSLKRVAKSTYHRPIRMVVKFISHLSVKTIVHFFFLSPVSEHYCKFYWPFVSLTIHCKLCLSQLVNVHFCAKITSYGRSSSSSSSASAFSAISLGFTSFGEIFTYETVFVLFLFFVCLFVCCCCFGVVFFLLNPTIAVVKFHLRGCACWE